MRKNILSILLILSCTVFMTGCGLAGKMVNAAIEKQAPGTVELETVEPDTETEEATSESSTMELPDTSTDPNHSATLGDAVVTDDTISYLTVIDLENENGETITVLIPIDEYGYSDDSSANASSMGLSFEISADPYVQYNAKDYTIEENLQYMLDSAYDEFYYPENRDMEFSEIQGDESQAKCDISYIKKDYDGTWHTYYDTYYLWERPDHTYVSVVIQIVKDQVTGKTPKLISELESFYPFTVNWNMEEAQEKEDHFLEDPSAYPNLFSVGDLLFELPYDWDEDSDYDSYGNYNDYYYAPDGKSGNASTLLQVSYDYSEDAENTMQTFLADPKQAEIVMQNSFEEKFDSIKATNIGDTVLGETIKLDMTYSKVKMVQYYGMVNGTLYVITAADNGDDTGIQIAQDIMENGRVREY